MTLKEFFESEQLLAINLKTKEQSIIFSSEADKLGKKWYSGSSYLKLNCWDINKEKTCYDNEGLFTDIFYYDILEKGKVLNFEDIEWEEEKMNNFTKKDIKNGAVVELRNSERYLKVDDTLLRLNMSGNFMPLQKYDNNLKCIFSGGENLDIMKILNPKENKENENCCNLALCDIKEKEVNWTWERKEIRKIKLKDMSIEQYGKWFQKNCMDKQCRNCIFRLVRCTEGIESWVCNKHLYSEVFLNQEIEIEE